MWASKPLRVHPAGLVRRSLLGGLLSGPGVTRTFLSLGSCGQDWKRDSGCASEEFRGEALGNFVTATSQALGFGNILVVDSLQGRLRHPKKKRFVLSKLASDVAVQQKHREGSTAVLTALWLRRLH